MATYQELADLKASDSAAWNSLFDKISVAIAIKAQSIAALPTPTQEQKDWARGALASPRGLSGTVINYVIAANSGATTAQILSASDSAIQSNVDDAVDNLFGVS